MATICMFVGAMETILVGWFVGLVRVHILLLFSLHCHLLLNMILHKSGSQQS